MAQSLPEVPELPNDTSRLLARRIDIYAQEDGSRTWASIPKTDNIEDGFRDLSYATFARAIDRAAWWLDDYFKDNNNDCQCFAYIGPKDLRYAALTVASIKIGRKIFLPSPMLAPHALQHLIGKLDCDTVLFGDPLPPTDWFKTLRQLNSDIQVEKVPSFDTWFDDSEHDQIAFSYDPTWDEAIDKPVFVLNSSGTTGMPKAITYRNSTLVYFDAAYQLGLSGPALEVNDFEGKRVWAPMPMAHLGGIYTNILHPVYLGTIPVLAPANAPLTVQVADQMTIHGDIVSAFHPPFLLQDIVARPESLQLMLNRFEFAQYGSAPLGKATGDLIAKKMHLKPQYGSTEMPFPPYLRLPAEDWEWYSFHPFAGAEFCHRHNDLCELVMIRKEEFKAYQPCFTVMPEKTYLNTGDLFSPHPDRPGLWRYRGRTDDIIVCASGVNVHTTAIQNAIEDDPRIRAAIVGGKGKVRPFLLLELVQADRKKDMNFEETQEILEELWPGIEAVNERLELHSGARIHKDKVIIAPPTKIFKRLAKGSVDQKNTIKEFELEIDQCFKNTC